MTIKKFQGKTKEEAIAEAKKEMGEAVVIMNVKEVHGKGLFGVFKKSTYEVTAAIEDDGMLQRPFSVEMPSEQQGKHTSFDAVVDDDIKIPPINMEEKLEETKQTADELALKDAFAAVNEVIAHTDFTPLAETSHVQNIDKTVEKEIELPEEPPIVEASRTRVEDNRKVKTNTVEAHTSVEQQSFFRMLYKVLLENEVHEKYINQLMDDVERISHSTDGLQFLISNSYQKMILKLGQPKVITLAEKKPKVVFFIGPTGVGKTTTIAKIASKYKVEEDKKVALLTADTYRIAAAEQLRTYANILDTPLSIVYSPDEIGKEIAKLANYDLIFVDTAGFSHKNDAQRADMKTLLSAVPSEYDKDIYLVLSATTKYKDLVEITDIYKEFCEFHLIFTKLDETSAYGNIYNIALHTKASLSYVTTGQNVPDDIEEVNTQKLVKQLLGGR